MISEAILIPKVTEYIQSKGWKPIKNAKLRGRIPDIVGTRDGQIIVIETKAGSGKIENAIAQILLLKRASNVAYIALPATRISDQVMSTLRQFGIGLISVGDDEVKEVVKPMSGTPLPSVQRKFLGGFPRREIIRSRKTSSLEYLFRSRGFILILKLFFLNPGKEFHGNEIARRTALSASYVARELNTIQKIGLVNRREQGNLVLYSISKKSLIFDELKRIFLKYELLDELIAKELPTEEVKYALIYGSFARGAETTMSDIDLLVIGTIKEDQLLKATMKAQRKIGREINYLLWREEELAQKTKEHIPLVRELARFPVIMIVGEESEFKRSIE